MRNATALLKQRNSIVRDIDILTDNINDLAGDQPSLFTMNRLIQERHLLRVELKKLMRQAKELV